MNVGTGDNVLIAGFIIQGTQPKKVLLRAAGPSLATLSLNRSSLVGGTTATGTVTLTTAAPSDGAVVTLSSSAPSIASVPASVVVAAGATSASFMVTTTKVTKNAFATISASYGGATKSVSVTIKRK